MHDLHADDGSLVHLVRHGEVWNPDHVVYSDLPGFGLSALGHHQARLAATHLADRPVGCVVVSPLQRAIETALPIAAAHGLRVIVEPDLVEWRLCSAWVGSRWEELPGEQLDAYLADPRNLDFAEETLDALADRIANGVQRHVDRGPAGDTVVVSHQDPIHAGRRRLTGASLDAFNIDKPAHATVVSLDPATTPWSVVAAWTPPQANSAPVAGESDH